MLLQQVAKQATVVAGITLYTQRPKQLLRMAPRPLHGTIDRPQKIGTATATFTTTTAAALTAPALGE